MLIFIPFLSQVQEKRKITPTKRESINVTLVQKQKAKKIIKKVLKKKKKIIKKKPKKKIKPKPKPKKIIKPKPKPVPKPLPPKIEPKEEIIEKVPEIVKELPPPEVEPIVEEIVEEDTSAQELMASRKDIYFSTIYEKIAKYKKYPKKAKKFKQQGEVRVRFMVDASGHVSGFEIMEKSEYRSLNKAVKKLFKKLKSFDIPPPELALPLEITITISYTLK